jgi:hypothetical protein
VANSYYDTISEYNATTGAIINPSVVSGFSVFGIAISGNDLFVTDGSMIGEYNASTGTAINASLITGLSGPGFFEVEAQAVPEPSSWALMLGGLGLLAFWHRRSRRA